VPESGSPGHAHSDVVGAQKEQMDKFLAWVHEEGGVEMPVRLPTYMTPSQRARINWLQANSVGTILEGGCNWGAILAAVGGQAGLDLEEHNIELARILNPEADFKVGNVLSLPYEDDSFDTVLLPEILEHLNWDSGEVFRAIDEATRVARKGLLITFPDGSGPDAGNFKHQWLADDSHIHAILGWLQQAGLHRHEEFDHHCKCQHYDRVSAPEFALISQKTRTAL